jgi:hypothetical protein
MIDGDWVKEAVVLLRRADVVARHAADRYGPLQVDRVGCQHGLRGRLFPLAERPMVPVAIRASRRIEAIKALLLGRAAVESIALYRIRGIQPLIEVPNNCWLTSGNRKRNHTGNPGDRPSPHATPRFVQSVINTLLRGRFR